MGKHLAKLIFGTTALLALAGCGGGSSGTPAPAPVVYNQGNLPDDGYWLCRLDFQFANNGFTSPGQLLFSGEGLLRVKEQMRTACFRTVRDSNCVAVADANQFRCARAQNIGGLNDYAGPTTCRFSFNYQMPDGSYRAGAFGSRAQNQALAVRMLFNECRQSFYSAACSEAIFENRVACRPTE